jgi:type II secretory pathway component PulM
MTRLCWPLAGLLALVVLAMLYLFVVRGQTAPASDGRTAILLAPAERDLVLAEMRGFLEAVQGITQAVADQDADAAAAAARKVGAAAQQAVPTSLVGKLPLAFKRLGFDTHQRFDQLALDAAAFGDTDPVMPALATLMRNCTACHASFRFELESP